MLHGYRIGELAERTRTNAPTIRYYEDIGLLPRPERQEGNQRRYSDEDVRRLSFIRRCRDFGFPIEQVRTLAALVTDSSRSCMEARDIAKAQLDEVREKQRELAALEQSLDVFVMQCDASCAGGPGSECVILEDLAAPKKSQCCGPKPADADHL